MDVIYSLNDTHIKQLHELYQNEWWSHGRSLEQTRLCIEGSQIIIGLVDTNNHLTGFTRVLTDYIFKALIFDIIVRKDQRHIQIGNTLITLVKQHSKLQAVKHFELYCLPELFTYYSRHGFTSDVGTIQLMRFTNTQKTLPIGHTSG